MQYKDLKSIKIFILLIALLFSNISVANITVELTCQYGYIFVVVYGEKPRTTTVAITQAFKFVGKTLPPQPIQCKEK